MTSPAKSLKDRWLAMGKRERLLAVGTVLVILVWVIDAALVKPLGQRAHRVGQDIRTIEREVRRQQQLLTRRDYVAAEAEQFRGFLRPAGPKELEIAALLKELEELGKKASVSLGDVKPVPSEASGPYQTYTFEIQAECTFSQWVEWIYHLESSPSLFTVDRATIALKEKSSEMLKASVRITRIAMAGTPAAAAPAPAKGP